MESCSVSVASERTFWCVKLARIRHQVAVSQEATVGEVRTLHARERRSAFGVRWYALSPSTESNEIVAFESVVVNSGVVSGGGRRRVSGVKGRGGPVTFD